MHGGAQLRNHAGIATGSGSPPGSGCYFVVAPPAQLVAPGSQAPNLASPGTDQYHMTIVKTISIKYIFV